MSTASRTRAGSSASARRRSGHDDIAECRISNTNTNKSSQRYRDSNRSSHRDRTFQTASNHTTKKPSPSYRSQQSHHSQSQRSHRKVSPWQSPNTRSPNAQTGKQSAKRRETATAAIEMEPSFTPQDVSMAYPPPCGVEEYLFSPSAQQSFPYSYTNSNNIVNGNRRRRETEDTDTEKEETETDVEDEHHEETSDDSDSERDGGTITLLDTEDMEQNLGGHSLSTLKAKNRARSVPQREHRHKSNHLNRINHQNHGNYSHELETMNAQKSTTQPPPFALIHADAHHHDNDDDDEHNVEEHEHDEVDNETESDNESENLTVNIVKSDDEYEHHHQQHEEEPAQMGEDDSLSTILTQPVNPVTLKHQTDTISDVSTCDQFLDSQTNIDDDDNHGSHGIQHLYNHYTRYGAPVSTSLQCNMNETLIHSNHNNNNSNHVQNKDNTSNITNIAQNGEFKPGQLMLSTASESSSFDSGHGDLAEPSSSELIRANIMDSQSQNQDSSDLNDNERSGHSHSKYLNSSSNTLSIDNNTSSNNGHLSHHSTASGCPIYNVCDEERNVFKSLQNKLLEMDDFNQNYLALRNEYLYKKSRQSKDRRISLNRTKQAIHDCFSELYQLLQERENTLLFELDEIFKSQSMMNSNIDLSEENDNMELQKLVREHMSNLSHKIDYYQSLTNPNNTAQSTNTQNFLCDVKERKEHILKLGQDIEGEHSSKLKYFDNMYNVMKQKLTQLRNETHIDFVLDKNVHLDCCNFLRCNEFGNIVANIPKPSIKRIEIAGNDRVNLELEPHSQISIEPLIHSRSSRVSAPPNYSDNVGSYEILSYRISYCYHCTQIDQNIDEKQDKLQWETVELDNHNHTNGAMTSSMMARKLEAHKNRTHGNNPYAIDFEIDDLNLVNADLMVKVKFLLQKDNQTMWTQYSDCYQLTQKDIQKTTSFPRLDSTEFIDGIYTAQSPYSTSTQHSPKSRTELLNEPLSPMYSVNKHRPPKYIISDSDGNEASNGTFKVHDSYDDLPAEDGYLTVQHNSSASEDDEEEDDGFEVVYAHSDQNNRTQGHANQDVDDEDIDDGDELEVYHIDIVKFTQDLYFDQDELEQEMISNQQLIQKFMKGINTATIVNNELVKSIKNIRRQQELWDNNKSDILAIRKKPKISLMNTNSFLRSGNNHKEVQTTPLPQHGNNISISTDSSRGSLRHLFSSSLASSHPIPEEKPNLFSDRSSAMFLPHAKTPSLTEHIVRRLSKLSRKLSNFSNASDDNQNQSEANTIDQLVLSMKTRHAGKNNSVHINGMGDERMRTYGELLHILQEQPQYLSALTNLIELKSMSLWVKTVICDLFGDENDSRNEHLLLRFFEYTLADYCRSAKNIDLFLKGDTMIIRMISSFINQRCPENQTILKMILERPMKELIFEDGSDEKQLNLEIDPIAVYKQLLMTNHQDHADTDSDREHERNQQSRANTKRRSTMRTRGSSANSNDDMLKLDSLNSSSPSQMDVAMDIDPKQVASNECVQEIIATRIEQIQVIAGFFLDRMIENARVISFGVRWICKTLASLTKDTFADASAVQLNALIGKIIYSRYFEPALKHPYRFLNIQQRRSDDLIHNNFDIICQVLRSVLCNEQFTHSVCTMDTSLLQWIQQQQRETVPLFYEKLLDLNATELKDRLAVDRYLIGCKTDLSLSLKQLYLLHHELHKNQQIWRKDVRSSSHLTLLDVLDRLNGDAPYSYNRDEKITFDLTLIDNVYDPFFVNDDDDDDYYRNSNTTRCSGRNRKINANATSNQMTMNGSTDCGHFVNIQYNENRSDVEADSDLDAQGTPELKNNDELLHSDESYIYNVLFRIKFKDDNMMGIRYSLRELLTNSNLPQDILLKCRHSLKECLAEIRSWSSDHDKHDILNLVDSILERMNLYRAQHRIHGYNAFICGYHGDIMKIVKFAKRLQLKAVTFAKARDTMVDHTNYLQDKLLFYKETLNQKIAVIKPTSSRQRDVKFAFKNLLSQNVIVDDGNNDFRVKANGHITFYFVHQHSDCFRVQIKSKTKSKSKEEEKQNGKSSTLSLMKLLEMRDKHNRQFPLQSFSFDVDGTIDLLNMIIANKI
eukprot:CAMPEP_0197052698 /NCGR_PEP_ID=MMETSP1384-20130603/27120_1 /TAXON_ID=29189 /ORGANISM="Ammonia sp." /LENGTH=2080 /DNA_ID=CAMNT_0042485489 /DNA_START=333 /DNA_END=6575 /DNA_ORIENTATION=+